MLLRKRSPHAALRDYSVFVTAWLLAVAIPPLSPWWMLVIGLFFAVVVAKQLYGGLGQNPFNPAMIGLMVFMIRSWGGFPDGVAFSVLLANMTVPLIDHYTKPRTYGH
jgi:Na+-translocating ferredoxin:NAD+ oxidoreductase RnfD subunit